MDISILSVNLRRLRLEKNYTQGQAAQLLNVSPQSVSRWECGSTLPEVTLLPEIARLYAVTVDDLFREDCCAYANYAQRLLAVYESTGRIEDFLAARQEFRRLFDAGSYSSDDLRGCGVLYQYLMQYAGKEAEHYFDRVLERGPDDSVYDSTWRQKISLMAQTGRSREAVSIHEKALSRDRENPRQWVLLTAAYFWDGDLDKAIGCAQEGMEKFPAETALRIYAGDICRQRGQYPEAFAYWQQALDQDSSFLDARYSMGFCCEELGQYGKAYEIWKELAAILSQQGFEVEKRLPQERAERCREQM